MEDPTQGPPEFAGSPYFETHTHLKGNVQDVTRGSDPLRYYPKECGYVGFLVLLLAVAVTAILMQQAQNKESEYRFESGSLNQPKPELQRHLDHTYCGCTTRRKPGMMIPGPGKHNGFKVVQDFVHPQ